MRRKASQVNRDVDRYVGLSLGGPRSDRTALTVIDYYKKQQKAFIIDVYESIAAHDHFTADEVLLDIIQELGEQVSIIAVDAPLTLPPCALGCAKDCRGYTTCRRPAVLWMRNQHRKAKARNPKLKWFAPYVQRPVDLYYRHQNPGVDLMQDDTLGANLAPQAARMQYLKSHLPSGVGLIEVWPKLAVLQSHGALDISRDEALSYRHMEEGASIREDILASIADTSGLFLYERDVKKYAQNMAAFDSLVCAWVALLKGLHRCAPTPKGVPVESGWVELPSL